VALFQWHNTAVRFFHVKLGGTAGLPFPPCRASAGTSFRHGLQSVATRPGRGFLSSRLQPGFSIQRIHPALATKTEPHPYGSTASLAPHGKAGIITFANTN